MKNGISLNGRSNTNLIPFTGFGNLVDEVFKNTLSPSLYEQMDVQSPKVNIKEDDSIFTIELLAPGFNKEDFTVDFKDTKLVVKVEALKKPDEKYLKKEFKATTFERVFKLPKNVDNEAISAKYDSGILYLTLPKKATKEEQVLSIKID